MSAKKSGDGERTAMLGYVPQYKIAANLIYDTLVDGTLEWIRVADPDAGQVDDIQVATTGCLNAYQVKWAEFSEPFTFNKLIQKSTKKSGVEKPSLFEQLAIGWKTLRKKYPERYVKVHLLSKHHLSTSNSKRNQLPMGIEK